MTLLSLLFFLCCGGFASEEGKKKKRERENSSLKKVICIIEQPLEQIVAILCRHKPIDYLGLLLYKINKQHFHVFDTGFESSIVFVVKCSNSLRLHWQTWSDTSK